MNVNLTLLPPGVVDHFSYRMDHPTPTRYHYLDSQNSKQCIHQEYDEERQAWVNRCQGRARKLGAANGYLCLDHTIALFPFKKDHEVAPFQRRQPVAKETTAEEIVWEDAKAIAANPGDHVRLFR